MTSLDETDPTFVDDLKASQEAVLAALRYFNGIGRLVTMPATIVRPNADMRAGYTDDGDLWVAQRWEIKHRSLDFTGTEDFPFADVIIDSVGSFERKHPTPAYYMIFNRTLTTALVIDVKKTRPLWRSSTATGRAAFLCPLTVAHVVQIAEAAQ